jgi:hypothetical protein
MFWDKEGDRGFISDMSGYHYLHQTVMAEEKGTCAQCSSQQLERAFAIDQ